MTEIMLEEAIKAFKERPALHAKLNDLRYANEMALREVEAAATATKQDVPGAALLHLILAVEYLRGEK